MAGDETAVLDEELYAAVEQDKQAAGAAWESLAVVCDERWWWWWWCV